MAKRRKRYEEGEDDEKHERWLVSYADFITLLFAFFVVMYALSSVNENKYRVLSDSLLNAFRGEKIIPIEGTPKPSSGVLDPTPLPSSPKGDPALQREAERLTGIAHDIQNVLAPLMEEGKVRVTQSPRGVTVEINASVLFAPGDARLSPASVHALRAVADVIKFDDHDIQIEGHTDSVPINNMLYPSNWELSSARAASVVRLFIESGAAEVRLSTIGYGSTRPILSNQSEAGRQRNRRVEVLIMAKAPGATRELSVPRGIPPLR